MNVVLGGFSEDQGICGVGITRCILIEYINEAAQTYAWSKVITGFTGVTTLPSTVAAIKFQFATGGVGEIVAVLDKQTPSTPLIILYIQQATGNIALALQEQSPSEFAHIY